jgi:hypothetical protein
LDKPAFKWGTLVVAALFGGIVAMACWIMLTDPKAVDFVSFWAAGKMAAGGAGAQIYDIEAHRAVERTAIDIGGLMPFPYPPPFALFVAPFGLLPYGIAFTAWIAVTGALYALAVRPWMPPRLALAQPAILINGFIGQNAFLTSALFLAGTRLLATHPMAGGAVLGLLVIKPQLALMLPVAMIAGRQWRAIAGAVFSVSAALLLGLVALGASAYASFFELLGAYSGFVAASRWPWHELASVYALLRYFDLPAGIALAIHGAVVAGAAAMVWQAWRQDRPGKVAILAAATLLFPPYLLSYDGVLLALPVAWLLIEAKRPWIAGLVWALSLLTVGSVAGFYAFPNSVPLAAIISLIAIHGPWRLRRSDARLAAPSAAAP